MGIRLKEGDKLKGKKRKAPLVLTGYDPRAVERAPDFTDGHLPEEKKPHAVGADAHPEAENTTSIPKAPDGISGDWQ